MTLAQRHGFTFISTPKESPIVEVFIRAHIADFGLLDDARSIADHWVAVCKPPGVYAMFGWRLLDDGGGTRVDISDFYCCKGRLGTLAAYAAMERIRTLSNLYGVPAMTATPPGNTKMRRAIERMYNVKGPTHVVYAHYPEVLEKAEVA